MIEISTALILLAACAWFFLNYRRETHLSHIAWVVGATQRHRDYLEAMGNAIEAERATELADTLNTGCGVVALKVSLNASRKQEVVKAAMTASADGYLSLIGVTSGALNHLPTKHALFWLAKKMGK